MSGDGYRVIGLGLLDHARPRHLGRTVAARHVRAPMGLGVVEGVVVVLGLGVRVEVRVEVRVRVRGRVRLRVKGEW